MATAPPANQPPTANAGADQNITLNFGETSRTVTLNGSGTDPENGPLTYSWSTSGTQFATTASTTVNLLAGGPYQFTLTVTDNQGASASSTTNVTINPPLNLPPTADAGKDQTIILNACETSRIVTLDGSGSKDPEGGLLTYSWSGPVTPSPANAATATVTLGAGDLRIFSLTVTDDKGVSATATTKVTVQASPNVAPVVSIAPVAGVTLPATVSLDATVTDDCKVIPSPSLSWSKASGPGTVTFEPAGAAKTTATFSVAGDYVLHISANDGELTTTATVPVTVREAVPDNKPPTMNPIGPKTVPQNALLSFTVTGSDPNNDPLTFSASPLPSGAVLDATTGVFSWTPGFEQAPGGVEITFAVSDGSLKAEEKVTITVTKSNRAPLLTAIGPKAIDEGQQLSFTVSATDPDKDVVVYTATPLPLGASIDASSGVFSWTPTFVQSGQYPITFRASDGQAFAEETVTVTVKDINQPPSITITSLPAPKVDRPYTPVVAATDPDNDTLSFSLVGAKNPEGMTIDPSTGALSWTPKVTDMGKTYTVGVSVTDNRGGSASRNFDISVADAIPPQVSINAPKEVIPGAAFTVSVSATDNVDVTSISLQANGQDKTCTILPDSGRKPFTPAFCDIAISLSQVQSIGTTITVTATATDASGNIGTSTASIAVVANPDVTPPTVEINAPLKVAPGTILNLAATARDNVGVASVELSGPPSAAAGAGSMLKAATFASVAGSSEVPLPVEGIPPTVKSTFAVPSDAPLGQEYTFGAVAKDFSGNIGTASTVTVVVDFVDTTLPIITLSVPPTVLLGTKLPVTLKVTDDTLVSSVEVYRAYQKAATFGAAVDQVVDLPLPDNAEAGMVITVEVKAVDSSGNAASATATSTVVAPEIRQGVVTGAVYDDTTGLPLEGATVTFAVPGVTDQTTMTDRRGRYSFVADEGAGTITVSKSGYTRVDRPSAVILANTGHRMADARLTPVTAPGVVSATLGGTLSAPFDGQQGGIASALKDAKAPAVLATSMTVTFPVGALEADKSLSLLQVGAQGLQGRLPSGWSPVAAFDLVPHGIALGASAYAAMPDLFGATLTGDLTVARWDDTTGKWMVIGTATRSTDTAVLGFDVTSTGQYVVIVGDAGDGAPAAPVAGQVLAGAAPVAVPQSVEALVTPQPKIIFYKPGIKSLVGTKLAASTRLASGTVLWANLAETYSFYTGEQIVSDPYAQDVVVYGFGRPAAPLFADYYVSPGEDFAGLVLEKGIINVTATVPPENADTVAVIGPQGSTVSAPGGESLIVPSGAVTRFVPVTLRSLDLAASGLTLPNGLRFLGGMSFSLAGGSLAKPAALSIPVPADFTEGGDLLLVTPVQIGGATRFAILGAASVANARITSTITIPGTTMAKFPGILGGGRVLLVQGSQAFGYAGGIVTGAGTGGGAFPGAVVSSDTLPLIALSGATGLYATAVLPGNVALTALDTVKMDRGMTSGSVAAHNYLPADISLKVEPPRVASVIPAAGAVDVPLADPVKIILSEPVTVQSVTPLNVTVSSAQGDVNGSLELSGDGMMITFRHTDPFLSNTTYTVSVQNLVDRSTTTMASPFSSTFMSINTAPPPAPPAANLSASIPGTANTTTVTGTQGTAGLHDTVVIVNLTTGARNPVIVGPNGGFSTTVEATKKDRLMIEITSPGGGTTTVQLPRFQQTNPDGSVSAVVGSEGGRIVLPEGFFLDVPASAFPDGETVKFKAMTQTELGIPDMPDTGYKFVAGFEVVASSKPTKYLNFSAPAPQGFDGSMPGIIAKLETAAGGPVYSVVDTAKLIDGRFATSSPPCPGIVDIAGRYFGMILNDPSTSPTEKTNRIRQYGMTLLHMSVPKIQSVVYQPFVESSPFSDRFVDLSGMSSMYSPIKMDFLKEPASIFLAKVGSAASTSEVQQALLETMCGTGGCDPDTYTGICIPVPSNQKVTIAVRSASTGVVLGSTTVTATGSGTTQQIDFSITDPLDSKRPQIVLTSWDGANYLENGSPIVVYFAEPVVLGPTDPVYLMTTGSSPVQIRGKATLDSTGRAVQFVPDESLPLGETFELHLADVKDKSGNLYQDDPTAGPRTFRTFKPYLLWQNTADQLTWNKINNDLGAPTSFPKRISLRDIDFKTLSPEESHDLKWHTTLVGLSYDSTDPLPLQFMTFDFSNPMFPRTLAMTQGAFGRNYGAISLLPDFYLKPRALSSGSPPYSSVVQKWNQRVLYYADSDPSKKICIDPASSTDGIRLTKWQTANCILGATCSTKTGGCGDLLLESTYNIYYSILRVFDVTDPASPAQMTQRLLSDNGSQFEFPRKRWAPEGLGLGMGLSVLSGIDFTHTRNYMPTMSVTPYVNSDTSAAYVANYGIGLAMVDLNLNTPDIEDRLRDVAYASTNIAEFSENLGTFVAPYYRDVKVLRGNVVAVAGDNGGSGVTTIEVFSNDLGTTKGYAPLPWISRQLTVVENMYQTPNTAGGAPVQHDMAFVTAMNGGLVMAEIKADGTVLGLEQFPMPPGSETRHVEVDKQKMLAYVSGKWPDSSGSTVAGILMVNLAGASGTSAGWDKRYVGKIPFTAPDAGHTVSNVLGFRLDNKRNLLYAAIEMAQVSPSSGPDTGQIPFAVLKLGAEAFDKATLKDASLDPSSVANLFKSTDGMVASVLSTGLSTAGQLCVDINIDNTTGLPMTYTASERPLQEGSPGYLDFSRGNTGTLNNRLCFDRKAVPAGTDPYPTLLQLDIQSGGQFVRRLFVQVMPATIIGHNSSLKTSIDSVNKSMCAAKSAPVRFGLTYDAKVTIRIDGTIVSISGVNASGAPVTDVYNNIQMKAGYHQIDVPASLVSEMGEHDLQITAVFSDSPDVREVFNGKINHEIEINGKFPLGHTQVKGVDVYNGQVSLQRDDLSLPGVGPSLQFSRSYSSAGSASEGPMGAGWSHNYMGRLIEIVSSDPGCGGVTLVGGEGSGARFTEIGTAGGVTSFKPQVGYHGELKKNVNSATFDYYTKARVKYHYVISTDPKDSFGAARVYRLESITDPHGNSTQLTYKTASPYTLSEATEVPLDLGGSPVPESERRKLVFTYANGKTDPTTGAFIGFGNIPEDRITKVEVFKGTTSLGIELLFDYDKYGNLRKASRDVKAESYDYHDSSPLDRHNMKLVTDPNNHTIEYLYYAKTDTFPGENTDGTLGTMARISFPEKYEFVKEILVGTGAEQVKNDFQYDFSASNDKVVTTVTVASAAPATSPPAQSYTTLYTMSPRGNIVKTTVVGGNPDGSDNVVETRWSFDMGITDQVYIKEQIDAAGRKVEFDYDGNGNLLTQTTYAIPGSAYADVTDRSGAVVPTVSIAYTYDTCSPTFNQVATSTDSEGNQQINVIDCANGTVSSTKKVVGGGKPDITQSFTYWSNGLIRTATDPNGFVTTFQSYVYGQPEVIAAPANHISTKLYDARGRMTSDGDNFGHLTEYLDHDNLDRVHKIVKRSFDASADQQTLIEYYDGGQQKSVSNGISTVSLTLDSLNRVISEETTVTDADSASRTLTSSLSYDVNGNKVYRKDFNGTEYFYTYDIMNRLLQSKALNPVSGNLVTSDYKDYDNVGNMVANRDIHLHETRYAYDWLYRPVSTFLPKAPYAIVKTYDRVGNVLSDTDANGKTTTYAYDGVSRIISKTDPVHRQMTFEYDQMGRMLKATDLTTGLVVKNDPYDGLGRPTAMTTEYTDPVSGAAVSIPTSFAYDDSAHTKTTTNARGYKTVETFNGVDSLVAKTVAAGVPGLDLMTTYRYDGAGNLVQVKDPLNDDIDQKITYDEFNRKIKVETAPVGGVTAVEKFYYDGSGNVVKHIDARNIETRTEYDFLGRKTKTYLVESISNGGADLLIEELVYDDAANKVTTYNANRKTTVHFYNELHQEVKRIDSKGAISTALFDALNKVEETDFRNVKTTFAYDDVNRLIETREFDLADHLAAVQFIDYLDSQMQKVEYERVKTAAEKSSAVQTVSQFDPLTNVRKVTKKHPSFQALYGAAELVMHTDEYDGNRNKVRETDGNGNVTTYDYDGADRLIARTDGYGTPYAGVTSYTYDNAGNQLTVKGPRNTGKAYDVKNTYDERYRKTSVETGNGNVTSYEYDKGSLMTRMTRPLGQVTTYQYDEVGKLLSVDDSARGGGTTFYAYSPLREKIAQQDANGNLTTYVYDSTGHLADTYQHQVKGTLSSGSSTRGSVGGNIATAEHWHYDYDANGNQTVVVDAKSQRVDSTYDYNNVLVAKQYSAAAPGSDGNPLYPQPLHIDYTYDVNGNLLSVDELKLTGPTQQVHEITEQTFDRMNRLLTKRNPDGKTLAYGYDIMGNRTSLTDADNLTTRYTYDNRNRIRTVVTPTSTGQGTTSYTYFADGLLKSSDYPNGTHAEMEYDADGRMSSLVNHAGDPSLPISSFAYTYDANGNRKTQVERHRAFNDGASETTSYDYDTLDRLAGVTYGNGASIHYTYDLVGNRLTETGTEPKSLTAVDRAFAYNFRNSLVSVKNNADPTASILYGFDGNGNTISKSIGTIGTDGTIASPTSREAYEYNLRDRMILVSRNGNGVVSFDYDYSGLRTRKLTTALAIRYLYDDTSVLQEYDEFYKTTTRKYNYGRSLHSLVTKGKSNYYLVDGLKSTSEIADETGAVVDAYSYDAWGGMKREYSLLDNDRKYTGHYYDQESGLHYFGARYYDDTVGRFLSQDTAEGDTNDPPSLHRYAYAHGNPLTNVDLYGYSIIDSAKQWVEDKIDTIKDIGAWAKAGAIGAGRKVPGILKEMIVGPIGAVVEVGKTLGDGLIAVEGLALYGLAELTGSRGLANFADNLSVGKSAMGRYFLNNLNADHVTNARQMGAAVLRSIGNTCGKMHDDWASGDIEAYAGDATEMLPVVLPVATSLAGKAMPALRTARYLSMAEEGTVNWKTAKLHANADMKLLESLERRGGDGKLYKVGQKNNWGATAEEGFHDAFAAKGGKGIKPVFDNVRAYREGLISKTQLQYRTFMQRSRNFIKNLTTKTENLKKSTPNAHSLGGDVDYMYTDERVIKRLSHGKTPTEMAQDASTMRTRNHLGEMYNKEVGGQVIDTIKEGHGILPNNTDPLLQMSEKTSTEFFSKGGTMFDASKGGMRYVPSREVIEIQRLIQGPSAFASSVYLGAMGVGSLVDPPIEAIERLLGRDK